MSVATTRHNVAPELGLGLRPPMYDKARQGEIPVNWLELLTENFMVPGGHPLAVLEDVCRHYPVAFHGVSMNLGGTDPLDEDYLRKLNCLTARFQPLFVSDHLCWTRHRGHHHNQGTCNSWAGTSISTSPSSHIATTAGWLAGCPSSIATSTT